MQRTSSPQGKFENKLKDTPPYCSKYHSYLEVEQRGSTEWSVCERLLSIKFYQNKLLLWDENRLSSRYSQTKKFLNCLRKTSVTNSKFHKLRKKTITTTSPAVWLLIQLVKNALSWNLKLWVKENISSLKIYEIYWNKKDPKLSER